MPNTAPNPTGSTTTNDSPHATSIIDEIRQGGPLAAVAKYAAREQVESLRPRVRRPHSNELVVDLLSDAGARLGEGIEASPERDRRECAAGCSACCRTVAVDVTPLEALAVAEFLGREYGRRELKVIKRRLERNVAVRRRMSQEERLTVRMECALLGEGGFCSVYPARPLVCAGVFSLSRAACEAAASAETLLDQPVPLDRHAKAWTIGVSGGVQRALVEAGLDGNLYELQSAVLCALNTPHADRRWLSGEDVFENAICTDAHSPPRKPVKSHRVDPPHFGKPSQPNLTRQKRKKAKLVRKLRRDQRQR